MSDPIRVETQPTPNINALKFVVNRRLTEGRSHTFRSQEEAAVHPLAARLFAISGVVQVFVLNDFVTVTREPSASWETIAASAAQVIQEHLGGA